MSPPRSAGAPPRRPPQPTQEAVDTVVRAALDEDLGARGDLTTTHAIPAQRRALGRLVAKAPGHLAGLAVFVRVFELRAAASGLDAVRIELLLGDGDRVEPGDVVARLSGSARILLEAERTALNLVQRLSGVATLTARFVELVAGRARILDTRKTTPGLRALEKYAVLSGGGENHRHGLFDEVMLKDNHWDLAGRPAGDVLADVRSAVGPDVRITAEARDLSEARTAVRGGADVVLLDNFAPAELARIVPELRALAVEVDRTVEFEASGGIDLDTAAAYAAAGVDRLSIGALTHSAPALDLSLVLEAAP